MLTPTPSTAELREAAALAAAPVAVERGQFAEYLVTSATLGASPADVWAWYRELLQARDDGLVTQANHWTRQMCYRVLAERLSQLADPFTAWRETWASLFVTDRERARFTPLDRKALYPSLHLLRVGAELLRIGARNSTGGARVFFEQLLAHTNRLVTNDPRRLSPFRPEVPLEAIDLAPRLLVEDWPKTIESYRHLLAPTRVRLFVAAALLEGGANIEEVEKAVETAPHRLSDSVAETRESHESDLNSLRYCDLIDEASGRPSEQELNR